MGADPVYLHEIEGLLVRTIVNRATIHLREGHSGGVFALDPERLPHLHNHTQSGI
jgi:hypothetical protein